MAALLQGFWGFTTKAVLFVPTTMLDLGGIAITSAGAGAGTILGGAVKAGNLVVGTGTDLVSIADVAAMDLGEVAISSAGGLVISGAGLVDNLTGLAGINLNLKTTVAHLFPKEASDTTKKAAGGTLIAALAAGTAAGTAAVAVAVNDQMKEKAVVSKEGEVEGEVEGKKEETKKVARTMWRM
jgi:hypothetical protein